MYDMGKPDLDTEMVDPYIAVFIVSKGQGIHALNLCATAANEQIRASHQPSTALQKLLVGLSGPRLSLRAGCDDSSQYSL